MDQTEQNIVSILQNDIFSKKKKINKNKAHNNGLRVTAKPMI